MNGISFKVKTAPAGAFLRDLEQVVFLQDLAAIAAHELVDELVVVRDEGSHVRAGLFRLLARLKDGGEVEVRDAKVLGEVVQLLEGELHVLAVDGVEHVCEVAVVVVEGPRVFGEDPFEHIECGRVVGGECGHLRKL